MLNQRQPVATASNCHHPHHHPYSPHLARSSAAFDHQLPQYHPHVAARQQRQQQQHYHDPALASLAYPPLQPPLQQPGPLPPLQQTSPTNVTAAEQQRLQQNQLSSPLGPNAATFQHPGLSRHYSAGGPQRAHARPPPQTPSMAQFQTSEEELAELQKLSNEYEPEVTGPLVGQRQPSTAITSEYASADPVYQAKTAALPQKYSHYRTVRGDGKCGWRAVAFGYFEALIHHGDGSTFSTEEARLRSMGNVMQTAGFDPTLFEDFCDETFELLRKIQSALQMGNAETVLLGAFNDEMLQNYVITHLRTLTAAWMKTHQENYAPWLLDQTIEQYCNDHVLPVAAEIDHVGLVALKDALLSPASMTLEVLYLDRSQGSGEATMHRFDPLNGGGYTIGNVRLLYRPGHYDLLYKLEDLPAKPQSAAVYLQYGSQNSDQVYEHGLCDILTAIPGVSFVNTSQPAWVLSTYSNSGDVFSSQPAVPTCTPTMPTPAAPVPQPQLSCQPVYTSSAAANPMPAPPPQMPRELSIRTNGAYPGYHPDSFHEFTEGPFRPSRFTGSMDLVSATSQLPLQTSIFRNSHFNTAHFLNPDFQPEQWDPEDEYAMATNKNPRHKNSG